MPSDGVMEAVDLSSNGIFGLLAGFLDNRPGQLRLDGLEDGGEDQDTIFLE